MPRVPLLLVLLCSISACATPEYRQEYATCEQKMAREIPRNFQVVPVTRSHSFLVPTGRSTCIQRGNRSDCQAEMRTEYQYYTAFETQDVNESWRWGQTRVCTAQACLARFGNQQCKGAG